MPPISFDLRPLTEAHLGEMTRLFSETIYASCARDYTPAQLDAWAAGAANTALWVERMGKQYFVGAFAEDVLVGFGSLEGPDYLDFLYVHKDWQGHGVASLLYRELEAEAVRRGAKGLHSHVSKTARRFFEGKGFVVVEERVNMVRGVEIVNYEMGKELELVG